MKDLRRKQYKQRGITLIALVLTIIVLLILAGISIAMLMGKNGIISQVQKAKDKTEEAKEEELRKLTISEAVTNEEKYMRNETYDTVEVSKSTQTDTGYLPEGIQPTIDDSTNNENAEREAVTSKGGFYISRYEAGIDDSNKLVCKKGAKVYNNVTQEESKVIAKTFINNAFAKSALCSGIQWDIAMKFVTGKDENYNVTTPLTSRHTGKLANLGDNPEDKICNVYDLEGNCREYIAERTSYMENRSYVNRGGFYGNNISASSRAGNSGARADLISFRFVIYVM